MIAHHIHAYDYAGDLCRQTFLCPTFYSFAYIAQACANIFPHSRIATKRTCLHRCSLTGMQYVMVHFDFRIRASQCSSLRLPNDFTHQVTCGILVAVLSTALSRRAGTSCSCQVQCLHVAASPHADKDHLAVVAGPAALFRAKTWKTWTVLAL